VHFDWTVSISNVIALIVLLAGIAKLVFSLRDRLLAIENRLTEIERQILIPLSERLSARYRRAEKR